ncbi:uncharacterized protein LOC122059599 isoform X1 [Macadamia integrifolia]|uniref:uncharacterized protein LOC122059599 isoform X1 n=1 Tax=Macadamia integrifolia TaxID=60698 RepID=UPI001C5009C8|nr:uncharacterized protein LOC122059599 isoform X1 [Macadamia integrifolia]XP_042478428.1 uncharacterized protein LOC122059599 isoform X1 [Macadamia integrifolia]
MDSSENLSASDEELETGNHGTEEIQQQLQILQSLIPNSTQTDARSILEDASDYLLRINQEIEKTEKELSQRTEGDGSSSGRGTGINATTTTTPVPHILRHVSCKLKQVETEKLMGNRFVVKIIWKKGAGVAAHVQRVIESLELKVKMTSINIVDEKNPHEMITTVFLEAMNETPITEEELHDQIMATAARLGVT